MNSVPPLSPGEQARTVPVNRRRVLLLLLIGAAIIAFVQFQSDRLNEYLRYFAEDRKPASLDFATLSESWTERTLEQRFAGNRIRCVPYQGPLPVERACTVDVGTTNGVPVLFMTFFFAGGHLDQLIVNIPWWIHEQPFRELVTTLGPPMDAAPFLSRRLYLHRWRLANGAGVFLNRRRPLNPLSWNSIQWRSPSSCKKPHCFARGTLGRTSAGLPDASTP